MSQPLLDLLSLQLDSLPIHKDALPLIRFRDSPLPNLGRKLHENFPLYSLQQYTRRLRHRSLHALGNRQLDWMRISDLQTDEFLAFVFGGYGGGFAFNCGPVSYTYKSQNRGVPFGDAQYVVL
jgi:hypothetical protein